MIEPTAEHVLVTPDDRNKEVRTAAGIIIPAEKRSRDEMSVILRWGEVKAVGAKCEPLKAGMRVAYNPFDAHPIDDAQEIVPLIGIRGYAEPN